MLKNLFHRKEKEPIPDFNDVSVTLKPIFGIRPGIYLTALFGLVILIVIFLVFFLPGIAENGTYLSFSSGPVRAGVWIDGEKAGVTPCEVLVHSGPHEFALKRPFYKPVTIKKEVGNFIFAIPFLPKRENVSVTLEVADIDELTDATYREFTQWALIKEFSREYQYPPVLSEAVKSIYADPTEPTYRSLKDLLAECLPHVCLPELARDYFDALLTVETKGGALTPGGFFRLLAAFRARLSANRTLPFWLYLILPVHQAGQEQAAAPEKASRYPTTKGDLSQQPWFQKALASYKKFLTTFRVETGARPGPGFTLEGITFLPVPEGSFLMGKSDDVNTVLNHDFLEFFPHAERVSGFYMAETEVTNLQFKRFIEENQYWSPNNKQELIRRRLVNEQYLNGWKNKTYPEGKASSPVTSVSAYAAQAYCDWLDGKIKTLLPGFTVRLPGEAEWEWAAAGGDRNRFKVPGSLFFNEQPAGAGRRSLSAKNLFGLKDMAGNVWEWCDDWYAKAAPFTGFAGNNTGRASSETAQFGGDKSIRGGSWADAAEEIEVYTRAPQPADWCTPYLGFRPVAARR